MKNKPKPPKIQAGFFFINFVILAFILIFGGCDRKKPIKVGFVGGLTGQLADLGTSGRNGVMLAVEERNAAGGINGRQVKLIVKNDEQNAEKAVKADRELIDEGVAAIIGHMTSTMSLAALPVVDKAGILMISPTTSTNEVSALDDYFMRLVPPYGFSTAYLARYAFNRLGLRKPAIVYDLSNRAFSRMVVDDFNAEFEKLGGKTRHVEAFTSGSKIVYPDLAGAMLKPEPDGVLIIAGAYDTAMLCQHIRIAGAALPIMASGWAGPEELVEYGGAAVEGIVFVSTEDTQNDLYIAFQQRFQKRFGKDPDFAAAYAYEAALILFEALTENADPATLKATILGRKNYRGIQGNIRFDPYGDPQRQHFIVTIENGAKKILERQSWSGE